MLEDNKRGRPYRDPKRPPKSPLGSSSSSSSSLPLEARGLLAAAGGGGAVFRGSALSFTSMTLHVKREKEPRALQQPSH